MFKRAMSLITIGILAAVVLAACGEATATIQSAATPIATVSKTALSGATPNPATNAMPVSTMPAMGSTTAMPGAMGNTTAMANTNTSMDPMTTVLSGMSGADFEINFMKMMITHHMSAIEMAKLATTNTKRPELLKLSQDITSSQSKEIAQMTDWLKQWHNAQPAQAMDMNAPGHNMGAMTNAMGSMDTTQLAKLKDSEFDKMFLSMMIEHHTQAVSMSVLLPAKTTRPELLKLGQEIVTAQKGEITQMLGWQKAWA